MAAKLSLLLLACSLAFLLVANATIIRTTVSEVEEENPSRGAGGSSCSKFRGMDLAPCMYWMQHSGGGHEMDPSGSSMYKQQCCGMMSQMDDQECRCRALKSMLMDECSRSPYPSRGQGMCGPMMMEKMMDVPQMCGLGSERCHFRMIVV